MFERIKERRQRELVEKIAMIKPTSKSELKQTCLMLSNLDIDKAEKMYDFLVKDMTEIPDIPPTQKSFLENLKEQSSDVFSWMRENQDILSQGVDFIKGLFQKNGTPAKPLPPIND